MAKKKTAPKKAAPKRKRKSIGPITDRIRAGKTEKEIMAALGIKSKATLVKKHYDELAEAGRIRPVPKAGRKKAKEIRKDVKVGKRGTVTVKADQLEAFGFKPGDKFEVKRTRGGVLLKAK